MKLKSCPIYPAYDYIFKPNYKQHFKKRETVNETHTWKIWNPPLWHSWHHIIQHPITLDHQTIWSDIDTKQIPPKQNTHPIKYKEEMQRIIVNYSNYCHIFTDGSKGNKKPGCTVILNKKNLKIILQRDTSTFRCQGPCKRSSTLIHLKKQQIELYIFFQLYFS